MSESSLRIPRIQILHRSPCPRRSIYPVAVSIVLFSMLTGLAGCGHFHPGTPPEYVYVAVKNIYLRDRVAVIANRVAEVTNGERLQVVEHTRRFLKVKTPQGAVGWIEEHAVLDQSEYDDFQNLAKKHASQPPVARAILYNLLYMHIEPGRKPQHFYLLPANTKVALLERVSIPKVTARSVLGLPPANSKSQAIKSGKASRQSFEERFSPPVSMEDWWLARDSAGHTGWMLAHGLEMDVPQAVAQYSENEKMLAAYPLRTINDPDSGMPDGKVPEYVTFLTRYKQGMPYDFDQVRVFTWDKRRHHYATAFRLRDVLGFFPITIIPGKEEGKDSKPVFSFHVAAGDDVGIDPATGKAHAAKLETTTYRMEGNLVHRLLPSVAKAPAAEQEQRPRVAPKSRRGRHHHR